MGSRGDAGTGALRLVVDEDRNIGGAQDSLGMGGHQPASLASVRADEERIAAEPFDRVAYRLMHVAGFEMGLDTER